MTQEVINKNPSLKDILDVSTDYLGFVDFIMKDGKYATIIKEIEGVTINEVPIPKSNLKKNKCVVTFKGVKKGLILSGSKLRGVIRAYGPPSEWIGKSLTLTANPDAKFKGKVTGGVFVTIPEKQGE